LIDSLWTPWLLFCDAILLAILARTEVEPTGFLTAVLLTVPLLIVADLLHWIASDPDED